MDPDPHILKIINSLRKRGFEKEANVLEDFFSVKPAHQTALVVQCPLCGNQPEPSCALCKGKGELVSIVADDEEDARISKDLKLD